MSAGFNGYDNEPLDQETLDVRQAMTEEAPAPFAQPAERPIDRLKPDSELHRTVLNYLLTRLEDSERVMTQFHDRWNVLERQIQAYISLPDWEARLKEMNDKGGPPKAVSIVIPYTYATIATVVTYHLQVFAGRHPMFQISSYRGEAMDKAPNMEAMLQYNADHTNYLKWLWQYIQDMEAYGVGIMLNRWKIEQAMRTKKIMVPQLTALGDPLPDREVTDRGLQIVYEGNIVSTIDPFMFFPDTRVPMSEVAQRGEFVFWRSFEGRHSLKRDELDGHFKWVDAAKKSLPKGKWTSNLGSVRSLMAGGQSHPGGEQHYETYNSNPYYQVDQGTIEIFPMELGLGDEPRPQKWLFTILNKSQIVQAEPFDADHGEHPVAVCEPYSVGYGFGQLGLADYMAPIQDALGWLYNSHQDNVRRVLNDVFVVDPSMIVMKDLHKNMGPGGRIRLKRSAFGQDVRQAIQQLQVVDVTSSHLKDIEVLFRIGRQISAVDENLMGLQDAGGRKTATEIRTAFTAAASRLAAQARLISASGITRLTRQMVLNIQQYLSPEFMFTVLGEDGLKRDIRAEDVSGDFNYPVHDGTLPLDRVAMMDLWKEILLIAAKDPMLSMTYSIPKIFEWVAELGGAKNIESFRIQSMEEGALAAAVQQGNMVPAGGGGVGAGPPAPGLEANPGDRVTEMAGAFA